MLEGEVKVIDENDRSLPEEAKLGQKISTFCQKLGFSKPMKVSKYDADEEITGRTTNGKNFFPKEKLKLISNQVKKKRKISVKVSISLTGFEEQKKYTPKENLGILKKSKNAELSLEQRTFKIEITSSDKDKLSVFTPHCIVFTQTEYCRMMWDGKYRGRDNHSQPNHDYYTVFHFGILSERIIL